MNTSPIIFERRHPITGECREVKITLHHKHDRSRYPLQAMLCEDQHWHDPWLADDNLYHVMHHAQSLIDFTDALGLPCFNKYPGIFEENEAPDGWDHIVVFGYNKRDVVVLDSPYYQRPLSNDAQWHSVWLPRQCDPYATMRTFPRLSARRDSCIDLMRLSERVAHLNFPATDRVY